MKTPELTEDQRYQMYGRAFATPEGAAVLDDLRRRYFNRSGLDMSTFNRNFSLASAAQRAMFMDIERYAEGKADGGGNTVSDSEQRPEQE